MSQEVRGVIARSKGAPVELVTINVPDPGPGEAVVKIQACGVCHTDLHYREGGIGEDYPYLLGHEAAGVVESVGAGVVDLAPGDYVILNWRAVCGSCRACRRGRPWYCFATHNAKQKMTLDRRHRTVPGARHRRVHRQDAGGRGPVHQGRSGGPPRRRRVARLRRDGRAGRGDQHRQCRPGRFGGGDRLRWCRRGRDRRLPAGRGVQDHRDRHRRSQAGHGSRTRRDGRDQLQGHRSRGRDAGAHRRLRAGRGDRGGRAGPRPTNRRSTVAISPAPSSWWACRPRRCSWSCRCWTSSVAAAP